jgi:type I restriction enzyme S subunit
MEQRRIERYITQTAKKTITGKDIKTIVIPVPKMSEQLKFDSAIKEIFKLKENTFAQIPLKPHLFNTLLQKAFKGEFNFSKVGDLKQS